MAMKARAVIRYLRIAPRKIRLVIDTIRGRPVQQAFYRLSSLNKKGARIAEEALKSAVANAKQLKMSEGALYVSEIKADGGPVLKRFMSRSMGRADRILKRTTHLTVVLGEDESKKAKPEDEEAKKLKLPFRRKKREKPQAEGEETKVSEEAVAGAAK